MYSFLPDGNRSSWVILIHVAFWITYSSVIFIANFVADTTVTVEYTLMSMLPYLLVFYFSIFWINRYIKMGPILSMATFLLTFIILTGLSYYYIYGFLPELGMFIYKDEQFREFFKYALLGYMQFYAYALMYFIAREVFRKQNSLRLLQKEKFEKEIENARLKEKELKAQHEKLEMEYAFLKAQVNPHFLHNTLNMLYSQAMNYSDVLAANISKLSNMMRYSFENLEAGHDLVSIQKEVKNLQRLIEINDVRHDNEATVKLVVNGQMENQLIPPLSLITIVENAFKYGDLSSPLHIDLSLQKTGIYFLCRNRVRQKNGYTSSHKIGLTNLRKRLELILPGKYILDNQEVEDYFITELKINA